MFVVGPICVVGTSGAADVGQSATATSVIGRSASCLTSTLKKLTTVGGTNKSHGLRHGKGGEWSIIKGSNTWPHQLSCSFLGDSQSFSPNAIIPLNPSDRSKISRAR